MFSFKHSAQVTRGALFFAALLTFGAATSLLSQQGVDQAPAATVAAPAVVPVSAPAPAPAASPLFARHEADDHTIAAAQAADRAPSEGGNHTIVVSTLVLVLAVVILVLLID